MSDDRDSDKKISLVPQKETGKARRAVTMDVVKTAYIAEGLSEEEICDRYFLSKDVVSKLIEDHNLPELRQAYIREGLQKIQNVQLHQAERLLDLETNFKKMRLLQLEDKLRDYMAYYSRHGDFYKRHPVSGEILKNADGIPMQLSIPNVTKEINQLKESVTLSEGIKKLMNDLDSLIHSKPQAEKVSEDETIIDIDALFTKK